MPEESGTKNPDGGIIKMTQKDKLKVIQESLDIITANCVTLGIDFKSLESKYVRLAIRMFIEGITYWHKKQKEVGAN